MAALRNLVTRMRIPATAALRRHPRFSPAVGSRGLSDYSQSQDQDLLHARMMYKSLYGSYKDAKMLKGNYEFGVKWGRRLTYFLGFASILGFPCTGYQVVKERLTIESPKQVTMPDNQVTAMDEASVDAEVDAFIDDVIKKANMEGVTFDEATVKHTREAMKHFLKAAVTGRACSVETS